MGVLFDPYEEMKRFRKYMDRMWDELLRREVDFKTMGMARFKVPEIEMQEEENRYIVKIDMPGVEKGDISVEIFGNELRVKAEKKKRREEKKKGYFYSEKSYAGFYRSVLLPSDVDPKGIEAEYKDGILTLKMRKKEKKKAEEVLKVTVK
ncbi:MAG: Hsp20/alpha crystallin family protein [Candidatus Anstonellales archaeon]